MVNYQIYLMLQKINLLRIKNQHWTLHYGKQQKITNHPGNPHGAMADQDGI